VAESQRRRLVLGRWRDNWLWWLPGTAVLAGLAGVVWWRWGLAGLAVVCGVVLVGWLIIRAAVMPRRVAPPVPTDILTKLAPRAWLEATDARTRLRHDLRNGALQLLTVVAVLAGAGLGFWQLAEDRDKALKDRQLTRQGQASERFTQAIDQLGSPRIETRIGGIYGLDQIAEQSPDSTRPVGEVLLAWLNGRPRMPPRTLKETYLREHAPDVQAALTVLTVIGRQRYSSVVADRLDLHRLSLRGANLRDAILHGATLYEADLRRADLYDADLYDANLLGAYLQSANLEDADLQKASLSGADLYAADLRGADLRDADVGTAGLQHADLRGADLRGAHLQGVGTLDADPTNGADLRYANLGSADLRGADLRGAHLEGAHLEGAHLEGANLRRAKVDGATHGLPGFDWRRAGAEIVP
jgi:uncharacterized protein YjbI with pentapeptide repeats